MALAGPDMCVHLCPDLDPGAGALGEGLADVDEADVDEVVDDACDARVPDVELVEALAMVSPNASVAPSAAAPAAAAMRGMVILTRVLPSRCVVPGPAVPGQVRWPASSSRPSAPERVLRGPSQSPLNRRAGFTPAARMGR